LLPRQKYFNVRDNIKPDGIARTVEKDDQSQNLPESEATSSPAKPSHWKAFLIPILIVLLTGACFYFFEIRLSSTKVLRKEAPQVTLGRDYYVTASVVELTPKNAKDESWDKYNNTAPDIYFEIYWKDQRVFQSTTKEDALVGKWSNAEVNIIDMALKGKSASVDAAIRAARINIAKDEKIEIKVYDSDLLGTEELAGSKRFLTSELRIGDTPYIYQQPGIRRLVLRVMDMQQTPDVLK